MEGLAQVFDALLKQGILPAAFIIGTVAFILALIGKIPMGNGHEIQPISRFFLGLFGFVLTFSSLGGAIFSIVTLSRTATSTPSPQQSSVVIVVTATSPLGAASSSANPTPFVESNSQTQPTQPISSNVSQVSVPLRQQQLSSIGTGMFAQVSSSDGQYAISESDLQTNHFQIQRIRLEENPNGCSTSIYDTDKVWFSSSANTVFTINGQEAGKLVVSTGKHGYIANTSIDVGDEVCSVGYAASGFGIIFGPDMYYHYDSYCYRGYC